MRKLIAIAPILVALNAHAQKVPTVAYITCPSGYTLVGSTPPGSCVLTPTAAPEIDPGSAAGALALLLAAVAIVRGRRTASKAD